MSIPSTMRAVRLHRPRSTAGPEIVQVDEVPVPEPGPRDVLVHVRACGLCASDVHVVQGVTPHGPVLPQVLGHEPAGVVAAVGDEVEGWMPGDRVSFQMARPCGRCAYCAAGRESICPDLVVPGIQADGALAEYVLADQRFLTPLPSTIPFEHGAIMTDAVATPYHALKRGGVGEGMTVAIFGLGGLGMHAVLLAKMAGAAVIGVDIDPVNLKRAKEWGADEIVDASAGKPARVIKEITGGGVDTAFEFVGSNDTVDQALKALKPGGRATVVGLTPSAMELMPNALFVSQELELVGSFGSTAQDLNELIDLADAGRLDLSRSVTHRLTLDDVPAALGQLERRDDHPIRMVWTND